MLNEVKKDPRRSAEDLQKSLENANISVDDSTILKTLNKNGIHGSTRVPTIVFNTIFMLSLTCP